MNSQPNNKTTHANVFIPILAICLYILIASSAHAEDAIKLKSFSTDNGIKSLGLSLNYSWVLSSTAAASLRGNISGDNRVSLNDFLDMNVNDEIFSPFGITSLYFNGGLGFESDQTFKNDQIYFGGNLTYAPSTTNKEYNVFDWPFAALRWLFRQEKVNTGIMPSFLAGYELTDPQSGSTVSTHTNGATYPRLHLEASMNTPLIWNPGSPNIYIEMDYRYYKETNPSDATIDAGLDRFEYFAIAMKFPRCEILGNGGPYIGISTGTLPLDSKTDHVLEAGINYALPH